jgi:hypothetical protein
LLKLENNALMCYCFFMSERFDPARFQHLYGKQITRLSEIPIDSATPHGWHGTSAEAVVHLGRYFRLPIDETHSSILFYARCSLNPAVAKQDAKMYAKINAVKHYVRQQLLPFKPSNSELFTGAIEFDSTDREAFLVEAARAGVTEANFLRHLRNGQATREGVLLGISKAADRDFPQVSAGQAHATEVALETGGGLPIRYVTSLIPLGSYEYEVIRGLQQNSGTDRII